MLSSVRMQVILVAELLATGVTENRASPLGKNRLIDQKLPQHFIDLKLDENPHQSGQ